MTDDERMEKKEAGRWAFKALAVYMADAQKIIKEKQLKKLNWGSDTKKRFGN